FDLLLFEQTSFNNPNQIFIIQNLMLALFNHIEGLMFDSSLSHSFLELRSPFQRYIELVEAHYTKEKELAFYLQKMGVTSKKLNLITKQVCGKTASQIIIERVLLEAKRELCFDEKSIKEIAFYLGYTDQYYFSRIFKSHTQSTPKTYRSQFVQ
ncbi:MAG: AraC family transcriptional regulator, partial [Bacteroidota bacterium]